MSQPLCISSAPQVLGWAPPANEEYVRVTLPVSQVPTFHISDTRPSLQLLDEDKKPPSPMSSNSSAIQSPDEPTSGGKHADPNLIPRPRNEFILFRCDYVKNHSNGGKRVRRPPGSADNEKTLSKQAAEAWHKLTAEERLYWKECANSERNEHARKYPDYRYKPKKTTTTRRRQSRSSPSKPDDAPPKNSGPQPSPTKVREGLRSGMPMPRKVTSVPNFATIDPSIRRLRSSVSYGLLNHRTQLNSGLQVMQETPTWPLPRSHSSRFNSPQPHPLLHANLSSSLMNWNGTMSPLAPRPMSILSEATLSLALKENARVSDAPTGFGEGDGTTEPPTSASSTNTTFFDMHVNFQSDTPPLWSGGVPRRTQEPSSDSFQGLIDPALQNPSVSQMSQGGEPSYGFYNSSGFVNQPPSTENTNSGGSPFSLMPSESESQALYPPSFFQPTIPDPFMGFKG